MSARIVQDVRRLGTRVKHCNVVSAIVPINPFAAAVLLSLTLSSPVVGRAWMPDSLDLNAESVESQSAVNPREILIILSAASCSSCHQRHAVVS